MFGRRRRAPRTVPTSSATLASPAPSLTADQLHEIVRTRMAEFIGEHGDWTVVRRSQADTDTIFSDLLVDSVSREIAEAVVEASSPHAESPGARADDASDRAPSHVRSDTTAAPTGDTGALESALESAGAPIVVWAESVAPVTVAVAASQQPEPVADATPVSSSAADASGPERLVA